MHTTIAESIRTTPNSIQGLFNDSRIVGPTTGAYHCRDRRMERTTGERMNISLTSQLVNMFGFGRYRTYETNTETVVPIFDKPIVIHASKQAKS